MKNELYARVQASVELMNDLILHIDKTPNPLETTYQVIGVLAINGYEENRDLIHGLQNYTYDLMGM